MPKHSKRKNSIKGGMPFPKSISIPEITTLSSDYDGVTCVAIHPTLPFIVTGHDSVANLWRFLPDGSFVQTATIMAYSQNYVHSVAFHPTLPLLATGSDLQDRSQKNDYSTVKLWRFFLPDGSVQLTPVGKLRDTRGTIMSLDFNPQGNLLASGNEFNTVNLWRIYPDGSTDKTPLESFREGNIVYYAKFHPKLSLLIIATSKVVKFLSINPNGSVDKETPLVILEGHTDTVTHVDFHQTLSLIATGSYDSTINLWRVYPDGSENHTPIDAHNSQFVHAVAFHPTLPILATCADDKTGADYNTVKLWRVYPNGSAEPSPFATLTGHRGRISSIVFDPKGNFLVTGSSDLTAKVWDLSKIYEYLRKDALTKGGLTSRLIKAFTTGPTKLVGQTARLDYSNQVQGRVGNPPDVQNPEENRARLAKIVSKKYVEFPRADDVASQPVISSHADAAVEFPDVSSVCRVDDKECKALYDSIDYGELGDMYFSSWDESLLSSTVEKLKKIRELLKIQKQRNVPESVEQISLIKYWIEKLHEKIEKIRR